MSQIATTITPLMPVSNSSHLAHRRNAMDPMNSDVLREVLHYFTRDGLEGLQLLSRLLRDLIDSSSKSLPLRRIGTVVVVSTY